MTVTPDRVAVLTDSTSDIPSDVSERHGITVLPLKVQIDGQTFEDGVLTQEEFFERMTAAPELPTTSTPPIGEFAEMYRSLLEHASYVVSIHISSKLSGTLESARAAAVEFGERVRVVDSLNLSMGLGLQVIEAAKAAAAGLDVDAVVRCAESARDRVHMLVGVDSLDNMVKGGRISRVVGTVGGALDVKVTITPRDGKLVLERPVRGAKAALQYAMRWVEQRMAGTQGGTFAVMHAMSEESAEWLRVQVTERYSPAEVYLSRVGSVIATHTGSGWGLALIVPE